MIVIDFETIDWGIQDGLGPGWPWGGCAILGMGWKEYGSGQAHYETDIEQIKKILETHDTWIAHNASYEAGIAYMLGVELQHKTIYCTKIMARMVDNLFKSVSLEYLSRKLLGQEKTSDGIVQEMVMRGIVVPSKSFFSNDKTLKNYQTAYTKASREAYSQLDRLQISSDIVKDYCIQDVCLTEQLYTRFLHELDKDLVTKVCKLVNVTTEMRGNGIRVDIPKTYETKGYFRSQLIQAEKLLWDTVGYPLNYNSDKQVKEWAVDRGLEPQPDLQGKLGYGASWVHFHETRDPAVAQIAECKKWSKAIEFTDTIITHEKNGRVYPEMNILEARTGRFSSRNPNIQQVPARDPDIGKRCRALYLPEPGEKWVSLDFSGQELRITAHYAVMANKAKCKYKEQRYDPKTKSWAWSNDVVVFAHESIDRIEDEYQKNPDLDQHQMNMDLIREATGKAITRSTAKGITFGKLYGMGVKKLAGNLKITDMEAKELLNGFDTGAPYMKMLNNFVQYVWHINRHVKTVWGRKIRVDPHKSYKALNAVIQGSAFDQTAETLIRLYDLGIIPLCCIHDENNFSVPDTDEGLEKIKLIQELMENSLPLAVPSRAEASIGNNWAEAK